MSPELTRAMHDVRVALRLLRRRRRRLERALSVHAVLRSAARNSDKRCAVCDHRI